MKNKNLPYLIGGSLLLLGVGGYFLYQYISDKNELEKSRKDKGDDTPTSTDKPTTTTTTSKPVSSTLSDSFPISLGTKKNKNVQDLQKMLMRDANGNVLIADGSWGKLTEGAMNQYRFYNTTIDNKKELTEVITEILASRSSVLSGVLPEETTNTEPTNPLGNAGNVFGTLRGGTTGRRPL